MRAKNEFKFLAAAYDRKLILERVVDGKLMCPEACCGAPVVECTCGEDCPHCNCFMIHKAMKEKGFTNKLLKEGIVPEDERDEPIRNRELPVGHYEHMVRLSRGGKWDTHTVMVRKTEPELIQKFLDQGFRIEKPFEDNEEFNRLENKRERARDRAREAEDKGDWDEWNRQENERERARDQLKDIEDNEEPKRGITGYQHTDAMAQAALSKDYKHKPYVSSYVGGESDGFRKIFAVLGSDGKIAYKTRDKKEAHQWLKDNYENI
jgi:hypothetical protein